MVSTSALEEADEVALVRALVQKHADYTNSELAWRLLIRYRDELLPKFVKVPTGTQAGFVRRIRTLKRRASAAMRPSWLEPSRATRAIASRRRKLMGGPTAF